jgi:hypothetical protein
MDQINIGDYVVFTDAFADAKQFSEWMTKIDGQIKNLGKLQLQIDGINSVKSLNEIVSQLNIANKNLINTIKEVDSVQAQSTKKQEGAFAQLQKQYKDAEISAKNLAAQYGAQSEQALQAAKSADILKQKLNEVNAVVKNIGKGSPGTIPFSSTNLGELEKERQLLQKTGEAVNDLERSQAGASSEATAWGQAQSTASKEAEEQSKILPDIKTDLDEYTGSLTANIQAQLENSTALVANRSAQKEIYDAINASGTATEEQTIRLSRLKGEELILVEANRNLTTTVKNQVKEFTSAEGSIDSLKARIASLTTLYNGLGAAEKRSAFGVATKAQLEKMESALDSAQGQVTKFGKETSGVGKLIGGAFQESYSFIRQLAYILPGIGMAGIIGAITDAVVKLTEAFFSNNSTLDVANGETEKYIKEQKELLSITSELTQAFVSYQNVLGKTNTSQISQLQDQLRVLEASGVNVEKTFALKARLAKLEAEDSKNTYDFNVDQALKERLGLVKNLQDEIGKLERIPSYGRSQRTQARIDDLYKELGALNVVATKENAIDLSREYHKKNFLKITEQQVKAENQLRTLTEEDASDKKIQKQKDYIANLQSAANKELQQYDILTSAQGKYFDSTSKTQEVQTQVAKFNADERRKYEQESDRLLVEEKKAVAQSILNDSRSTLDQQLKAINELNDVQEQQIENDKQRILNNPASSQVDRILAQKNADEQSLALTIQTEDQKYQVKEKFRLRDLEATKQLLELQIQQDAKAQKSIYDNENKTLVERLSAYQKFLQDQKHLQEIEYNNRLKQAGLSDQSIAKFNSDANYDPTKDEDLNPNGVKATLNELLAYRQQYYSGLKEVVSNSERDIYSITKSWADKAIEDAKRANSQNAGDSDSQYSEELRTLNDSFLQKKISLTKFLAEKAALEHKHNQQSLQDQLSADSKSIENLAALDNELKNKIRENDIDLAAAKKNGNQDEIDDFIAKGKALAEAEENTNAAILALKKKLGKDSADLLEEQVKEYAAAKQKEKDLEKQLGDELISLFQAIGDSIFEKDLQALQQRSDLVDKNVIAEKNLVEQSILNANERQKKETEIDAKASAQKHQIEQQQKKDEHDKAVIDKAASILGIIVHTAEAEVEALSYLSNPLTAPLYPGIATLIGSIGAVQLGIAAAAPIPRLFKGRNLDLLGENSIMDATAGTKLFWVDDGPDFKGNAPETILRADGTIERGGNKPRLVDLAPKDIVVPHGKEHLIAEAMYNTRLGGQPFLNVINIDSNALNRQDYMQGVKLLREAIRNQPTPKMPNPQFLHMKAWIKSGLPWREFNK